MQKTMRFVIRAGATAVALAGAALPAIGTAAADSGAVVPFSTILRMCDFRLVPNVSMGGYGDGVAVITSAGNRVRADISLNSADPDTQHMARLILLPRSEVDSCAAGGPGTVVAPLYTDDAGNGTVTLEEDRAPGATGAWVLIEGPQTYRQPYGQIYTSDFVAAI